jgi:SOS-response transcriptional repressor LexA
MGEIIITKRNGVNTKSKFELSQNVIISPDMIHHDDNKAFGERIRQLREELKLTQPELAKRCGWDSQSRISHYEKGTREPTLRDVKKIAKALSTDPIILLFGYFPFQNTPQGEYNSSEIGTAFPKQFVPLISWTQAAKWYNAPHNIIVNQHTEFVPSFSPEASPNCYALKVEGDSMTALSGYTQTFRAGEIIIIDPEKKPENNSFVIAYIDKDKEITFKQYVIDGGKKYLKPLNPQYPIRELMGDMKICGTVIATFMKF